jgi:hypothetical protein
MLVVPVTIPAVDATSEAKVFDARVAKVFGAPANPRFEHNAGEADLDLTAFVKHSTAVRTRLRCGRFGRGVCRDGNDG